jgi:nucleoside triphosphatase
MDNWRIIVVGIIQNSRDEYLICKKPETRGVFPGQWALPGGGIEESERMFDALRREMREEVGIEIEEIKPLFFKDGQHLKLFSDGSSKDIYMIFLLFSCRGCSDDVRLGDEFEEYAWVEKDALRGYDLNEQTKNTFVQLGLIEALP